MVSIPELRKIAKSALLKKGLKYPGQDGRTLFLYKELQENRFHFNFTLSQADTQSRISFGCTFVSNEIGNAIDYIANEKHRVFPTNPRCSKEWASLFVDEKNVEAIVESTFLDAEKFAANGSFSGQLEFLLANLNIPGSHQEWHISALAVTRQTQRLQALLAGLSSPDRGGLWPYIKEPFILRAVDYSSSKYA